MRELEDRTLPCWRRRENLARKGWFHKKENRRDLKSRIPHQLRRDEIDDFESENRHQPKFVWPL